MADDNMFPNWGILAKQTNIGQSRTSALNPLQWGLAILLLGLGILVVAKVPSWIITGIGVSIFLILALFLISYIYFLRTNPDALRSEDFQLTKMAMEKGLLGDSLRGLKTIDAQETSIALPSVSAEGEQMEQQEQ